MKIILDTNVWRRINQPEYASLKQKLLEGKHTVFLSETVFTLESVQKESKNGKIGRLEFFQKISENHFSLNTYLSEAISETKDFNIKILRVPRIGMPFNIDLPHEIFYEPKDEDVHRRMNRIGEITRGFPNAGWENFKNYIKSLKIGEPWQGSLKSVPLSEESNFAKAVAEWADGDTVAACYGYDVDVLCTADEAKNAGAFSILSDVNRKKLKNDYQIRILSPLEIQAAL